MKTGVYFYQYFNFKIFADKIIALCTIYLQRNPAVQYEYEAKTNEKPHKTMSLRNMLELMQSGRSKQVRNFSIRLHNYSVT